MKQVYFLFFFIIFSFSQAQIVNIPDANFKNALVNTNSADFDDDFTFDGDVDTNNDGEIQVAEAEAVLQLDVNNQNISSLVGIEAFVNLLILNCNDNLLTSIDFSNNPDLYVISIDGNQLSTIDISNNQNLNTLYASDNNLTSINIGQHGYMDHIILSNNQLTTLDISYVGGFSEGLVASNNLITDFVYDPDVLAGMDYLYLDNNQLTNLDIKFYLQSFKFSNNNLEFVSFKNGVYDDFLVWNTNELQNNPNLSYFCADQGEFNIFNQILIDNGYSLNDVVVNSYCSFTPGGTFYTVEGQTQIDVNTNGCDGSDPVVPNLIFGITDGSVSGEFFANTSGSYSIPVQQGMHTITPQLENMPYWTVSPPSFVVDFPTDASPFTQDICVVPNGSFNDLEVIILPVSGARPGFDADYKLVYKNKGTTTLSGQAELTFQDDVMDFVSALPVVDSQISNMLAWDFANLQPFESREIEFTMNINAPTDTPPVNGGDILEFVATVSHAQTEETPEDNIFTLNQTVVNSFDPNDKTCLEGETVSTDKIGEYVHYMIRFENTGTAEAVNIVVKDVINTAKLDVSTFIPLTASHDFWTRINDNVVEFIFEAINLPFDDANNDGYVTFKIKTQNTLQENDTFENDAEIYFDFNFPIVTDENSVLISNSLSTTDFTSSKVKMYPNPVNDVINLESQNPIDAIAIYDIHGRLLNTIKVLGQHTAKTIDVSQLQSGTYFIKVSSENSFETIKVIKE